MTVLEDCPEQSLRSRFKFYFKQVVPTRQKKKEDVAPKTKIRTNSAHSAIGEGLVINTLHIRDISIIPHDTMVQERHSF